MNDLRPYLCGPIADCTDAEAIDWRERALAVWPRAIDPMARDFRGKEGDHVREIIELDKRDIRACDVVLVNFTAPKLFIGASMEILYAWEREKPVVLWANPGQKISPWLRYHCLAICHTWEDVVAKIREIGQA